MDLDVHLAVGFRPKKFLGHAEGPSNHLELVRNAREKSTGPVLQFQTYHHPANANFDLGEIDIEGMLTWAAEKMGVPDARVAHA
jgi:hypothetical protein